MNRHRICRRVLTVLLVVVVVLGTGLGGAVVAAQDDDADDDDDDGEEGAVDLGRVDVSASAAIATAENETNGTVVELELFTSVVDQRPVWEVGFALENGSEREVFVDATDGSVLGVQTEPAELGEEEELPDLARVEVAADAAIAVAENETNGTVVELDLFAAEVDNRPVWEVEFVLDDGSERDVFVDATDGRVLDVRTEPAERGEDA